MASFKEMKGQLDEYYPLYINGKWVDGEEKERLDVFCPANNETITSMAVATKNDVDKAVQAARAALPVWAAVPLPKRVAILQEISRRITANVPILAVAEGLDTGQAMGLINYMVAKQANLFSYFGSLLQVHEDGTNSENPGQRTMIIREPIGVVGCISAWNTPSSLQCMKLAPALAAGNCVILKPSSFGALFPLELVKLIADLLPPGVVNIVNGRGSKTGQWVLDHPGIDKLSFTGSTEVGIDVGLAAAKRIIPATLELGGKSAGIYFADMDQRDWEIGIGTAASMLSSLAGQMCAQESRVLVEESIYDQFVERLADRVKTIKLGFPWDPDAQMGPINNKEQLDKVLEYIEIGKAEGARLVCGGERFTEGEFGKGNFVMPTVFADVTNDMRIAREEIFGPVLSVIKFKDEAEAIAIANDSPYGLSGSIHTGDLKKALRVAHGVKTGTIHLNGYTGRSMGGGAFGGYKQSGIGRENYKTTFDSFCMLKTINFPY